MSDIIRKILNLFPRMSLFLRNSRDLMDQKSPAQTTQWGFTLAGHEDMANGIFEPQETQLVRDILKDVDLFINIGANVGYYCCHALSLEKPVIAVEPITRNLYYLLKNIQNNGWKTRAQIFPVALGHDTNILEMWGGGTGASLIKGWASIPESYVTQVPVLSLDRVIGNSLQGKRALILVDIEGAELMMLQGAIQTLAHTPRPIWIVEISSTEHQPTGTLVNPNFTQTFDIFFNQGYRAFTVEERSREVTKLDVLDIATGKCQIGTHNFLFR
ncbi:FkbM family methyltransferase [Thiothrix sp.]|jgi:FkbM family methyltransferase|uniref:FkbM family methyltransferase n=1 Tax=Thiothrix sp. TaxID=1032 RepID=UPI00257FDCB7|nr:FkbM family methyltransferase [Thiothrix sp.]